MARRDTQMTIEIPAPAPLVDENIATIKAALLTQYPRNQYVLGAQLGAFVRKQLPATANLKSTFGGLKKFISTYFSNDISLCGKRGKDDLYAVAFNRDEELPLLESKEHERNTNRIPSSREIMRKAIDYLSDEDISKLAVPLGAVAKAIAELTKE
jgi:hypothetical protein